MVIKIRKIEIKILGTQSFYEKVSFKGHLDLGKYICFKDLY